MRDKIETEIRCLNVELGIYQRKARETEQEIAELKKKLRTMEREVERDKNLEALGMSARVVNIANKVVARCNEVKHLSTHGNERTLETFYKLNSFVRFGKLPRLFKKAQDCPIHAEKLVMGWAKYLMDNDDAKKSESLKKYVDTEYERAYKDWMNAA